METPVAKEEAPPPPSQPAAEEDGMLSATAAMARDAAVLFQSRRYAECAEVLAQLLLKKEGDQKVLHNMAITESFLDGCPDPKRLLKILGDLKVYYYYPFSAHSDPAKLFNNLRCNISGPQGFEAVMRIRCSQECLTIVMWAGKYYALSKVVIGWLIWLGCCIILAGKTLMIRCGA